MLLSPRKYILIKSARKDGNFKFTAVILKLFIYKKSGRYLCCLSRFNREKY